MFIYNTVSRYSSYFIFFISAPFTCEGGETKNYYYLKILAILEELHLNLFNIDVFFFFWSLVFVPLIPFLVVTWKSGRCKIRPVWLSFETRSWIIKLIIWWMIQYILMLVSLPCLYLAFIFLLFVEPSCRDFECFSTICGVETFGMFRVVGNNMAHFIGFALTLKLGFVLNSLYIMFFLNILS